MAAAYYTYIHCKPDGTPFYVGKGTVGTKRVRSRDLRFNRNDYHNKVVSKYGAENIQIFVFLCDTETQAFADERQQITALRRDGYSLTNITGGGDGVMGGRKHSEASKRRMHLSKLGNKCGLGTKRTAEQRLRFSVAQRAITQNPAVSKGWFKSGRTPWNKGQVLRLVCSKGHELSGDNLHSGVRKDGRPYRNCRVCERAATAAYNERKRGTK